MKCVRILCVAWGMALALALALPELSTGGDAEAAEQEALALLRQTADKARDIRVLFTHFTQEKKLSILDAPLRSEGYMCVQRQGHAAGGTGEESVLWVYEKPAPSGFAQYGGEAWLWTGEDAARRRAQGAEAAALKAVATHILAWIHIRPEEVQRLYRLRLMPSKQEPKTACVETGARPVLRLEPRQTGMFFTAVEVTLLPKSGLVKQLRFEEKNGDATVLTFDGEYVNGAGNEALPPTVLKKCLPPRPLP